MTTSPFSESEHYTVDPGTGCWNWTGKLDQAGYAMNGGSKAAHQVHEAVHGPIPPGLMLRHRCHNRACVNPEHLTTGTATDNGQDKRKAGRGTPERARLARDDVHEIIRRCELLGEDIAGVARDYKLTPNQIRRVLDGQVAHAWGLAARQALGLAPPLAPARRLPGLPGRLPAYGEVLRWRREQRRLSQHAVAAALGCQSSFISQIENGYGPPPDHGLLAAGFLQLPTAVMVERVLAAGLPEDAALHERLFGVDGWLKDAFEAQAQELLDMMGLDQPGA